MSTASTVRERRLSRTHPADQTASPTALRLLRYAFEAQADARPPAVAVSHGGVDVTYVALECYANRLARHLRRRGVKAGSPVGMLLPRSVDAYAALLGILKAGAAYVPLDPEYPAERIAYILEDSDASVLVTTEDLAQRQGPFASSLMLVDADRAAIDAESCLRLAPGGSETDVADLGSIISSPSGSAGHPTDVMVDDRDASLDDIWLAIHAGENVVPQLPA